MLGVITRTKAVKARAQRLVQLKLELAKLEGKQKATALGIAGGLGIIAGVLVLYAIGFAFAAAAVGLAEAVPLWLSLLIVAVVILLVAAVLALLAKRFAQKASPATSSPTIEEVERTMETLQSHV